MIIHPFLIRKGEKPPVPGMGHRVRFYDYDGTLLKTQYVETGNNAVPPTLPDYSVATEDRPAITFQAWNNSIYNIQRDTDLGAIYKTNDDKTYLYMEFTPTTGKSPTLFINKTDTTSLTVDWGDTTVETNTTNGNTTLDHTYAEYGKYTIKIYFEGTYNIKWKIGQNASSTTLFGDIGNTYSPCLKGLYLGGNISTLSDYSLRYCYNLTKITMPTLVSTVGSYCLENCFSLDFFITPYFATIVDTSVFQNCYSLAKVIPTNGITLINNSAFANNFSLKDIILPDGLTTFNNSSFSNNRTIRKFIIPANVTTLGTLVFSGNVAVKYYIFLPTTPPTMADINVFTQINPLCKIYVPDESVEAYKTVTNWDTYADHIYPLSEFKEVNNG